MTTNARGGFMQSLGRAFTGESIFMANYIAEQDGVSIGFASTVPGSVMPININSLTIYYSFSINYTYIMFILIKRIIIIIFFIILFFRIIHIEKYIWF